MDKPNLMESVDPCSGHYSWKKDIHLNAWLLAATVTYSVALLLAKRHPEWSSASRALVELTPLLPGTLYLRSWLRFIRGMDELQQRIQLWAVLYAAVGTILVGAVIDTLNACGVTFNLVPHGLGLGGAFLVMFVLWLVASRVIYHRYK